MNVSQVIRIAHFKLFVYDSINEIRGVGDGMCITPDYRVGNSASGEVECVCLEARTGGPYTMDYNCTSQYSHSSACSSSLPLAWVLYLPVRAWEALLAESLRTTLALLIYETDIFLSLSQKTQALRQPCIFFVNSESIPLFLRPQRAIRV